MNSVDLNSQAFEEPFAFVFDKLTVKDQQPCHGSIQCIYVNYEIQEIEMKIRRGKWMAATIWIG